MVKGATLTLTTKQAEYFVRNRISIGEGTNEERMRRQKEYLKNAVDLMIRQISQNPDRVGELLDAVEDCLIYSFVTKSNSTPIEYFDMDVQEM